MPYDQPLKPCPFCNMAGDWLRVEKHLRDGCLDGEPDAYEHHVICPGCAAIGPWHKTEGNARRFWNLRPAEDPMLDVLRLIATLPLTIDIDDVNTGRNASLRDMARHLCPDPTGTGLGI